MLFGLSNYGDPFPYPLLGVSATLSRVFSTLNYLSLSVLDHSRKDKIIIELIELEVKFFDSNDS
jgi:hypothetical protein